MKYRILKIGVLGVLGGLLPMMAQGQLNWNTKSSGTHLWSEGSNWDDGIGPLDPQTGEVQIRGKNSGVGFTILFDSDQILEGGLTLADNTTTAANVTLNLAGHQLVFNGGELYYFGASGSTTDRTTFTFSGGRFQFGDEQVASIHIGGRQANALGTASSTYEILFTPDSVFDTRNTGSVWIASGANTTRNHNVQLNLSGASLVSGSEMGVFRVHEHVEIGSHTSVGGGANLVKKGRLLMGAAQSIEIGQDLIVGQSLRTNDTNHEVEGTFLFSADDQGTANLTIGRDLRLGVGAAKGEITGSPELHTRIGTSSERGGVLYVGYKNTNATGNAEGSWVAAGGTFAAYVEELRIGETSGSNGNAVGVLDLRNQSLQTLDIDGDAVIGRAIADTEAVGTFYLQGGNARSHTLTVGESGGENRSLLNLDETLWRVEERLVVGANGDIRIEVGLTSAGLDLAFNQWSDFVIEEDGLITVNFNETVDSSSIWGIRMEGNHLDSFMNLIDTGLIVGQGEYADLASVWQAGGYTHYGLQTIPEPAEAVFGILALVLTAGIWRRYRKSSVRS